MGTGKTFLANLLIGQNDGQRISFADPIKEDVIKLHLTPDGKIDKARDRRVLQLYGGVRRGEKCGIVKINGKKLYITNGNLCIETPPFKALKNVGPCYPDYFINLTRGLIKRTKGNILVDDIRRINEAKMLKSQGFTVIKLFVEEKERLKRLVIRDGGVDKTTFNDVSESEVDSIPFDFLLDNSGTLEETNEKLQEILTQL